MIDMENNENILLRFQPVLDELNRNEDTEENNKNTILKGEGTLLFFSFDIVGSTRFKVTSPTKWVNGLKDVFKMLQQFVDSNLPAKIWRILGDELIFVINPFQGVSDIIEEIYEILQKANKQLSIQRSQLSLKAAAWIAIVSDEQSFEKSSIPLVYKNLYYNHKINEDRQKYIFEFLGNDIDAGFRIKQYSFSNQLILSYELAYILLQSKERSESSEIVLLDYVKLKGIWDSRPYPILCYYDRAYFSGQTFAESLPYDAKMTNEHVREYLNNKLDTSSEIKKMARDLGLADKIKILQNKIDEHFIDINDLLYEENELTLHLVAVACNFVDKTIFIARRIETKRILPGKWEFGCAKADRNENLIETLKNAYKNDFDLDIELLIDKNRKEKIQFL